MGRDNIAAHRVVTQVIRSEPVPLELAQEARDTAEDLLMACEAFVEQATKVSGFPQAYEPYMGALVLARAAIAKATGK